ncbi:MAG: hypothetical protein CVV33_05790 [Methanomicrobiales archaeon HGW-Methanomicrobiales-4]|nr:MAG: hypothetical protein CVV33_05790 [Methanomicrobiales archaeon HGW-Methanomicrobiales-4]
MYLSIPLSLCILPVFLVGLLEDYRNPGYFHCTGSFLSDICQTRSDIQRSLMQFSNLIMNHPPHCPYLILIISDNGCQGRSCT